MLGLLNLNKPKGATSRDAVNRVQWLARRVTGQRKIKVGHAGTLDPIATGVLVICLGSATRLIEYVQRMPKRYCGTFLLGHISPSDDVEIEPVQLIDPPIPTIEQIESALPAFVGQIQQVPPTYSAIKIDGQKAYNLARAGKPPEMKPRPVTIYQIEIVRYEYPELVLDIRCGGGTYIRSLGRDLAKSLGTAAVMSELVRTAIGNFAVTDGVELSQLEESSLATSLLPAASAVANLAQVELTANEIEEIRHGRPIADRGLQVPEVAMLSDDGELCAVGVEKRGGLWPTLVLKP